MTKDMAELTMRPNLLSVFSFLLLDDDELNGQNLSCKNTISAYS